MPSTDSKNEVIEARDRTEWRRWLEAHHDRPNGVWLILRKKSAGEPRLTYDGAVEEALSFGWIDSRANLLDEHRFKLLFLPRKPGSSWARTNKERVERLIAQGLMAPAGMAKVEAAKRDGSWAFLEPIENLQMPSDLEDALAAYPKAEKNFQMFSASSKKSILFWIASAKRPETRRKRIEETVSQASQNRKANQYVRK
jgi:uncharacterized protein YdeI (YjbR/CyaY-like superfamily)